MVARHSTHGIAASMVMAQSPKFKGISLGYGSGPIHKIDQADFWQGALFESVDKLLVLDSVESAGQGQSWLRRENNRLLTEPFDTSTIEFSTDDGFIDGDIGDYSLQTIDIGQNLGLNFSLFSAFASGGSLIPLFWKSELCDNARNQVLAVLNRNGISEIPERHFIL